VSVVTSVGASSSVAGVGGGGGGGGMGEGGASAVNFEFAPCPGRHFVTYGGRVLMVDRTRAEQVTRRVCVQSQVKARHLRQLYCKSRTLKDLETLASTLYNAAQKSHKSFSFHRA